MAYDALGRIIPEEPSEFGRSGQRLNSRRSGPIFTPTQAPATPPAAVADPQAVAKRGQNQAAGQIPVPLPVSPDRPQARGVVPPSVGVIPPPAPAAAPGGPSLAVRAARPLPQVPLPSGDVQYGQNIRRPADTPESRARGLSIEIPAPAVGEPGQMAGAPTGYANEDRPQDWRQVNAPGFQPVVSPEDVRGSAISPIPLPAPDPQELAAAGVVVGPAGGAAPGRAPGLSPAEHLDAVQGLKGAGITGKRQEDILERAGRGDEWALEAIRESVGRFKTAQDEKARKDQVVLPAAPSRPAIVNGQDIGAIGGGPQTMTKAQYGVERGIQRDAERRADRLGSSTVKAMDDRVDVAEKNMKGLLDEQKRRQDLGEDSSGMQVQIDAARANLNAAMKARTQARDDDIRRLGGVVPPAPDAGLEAPPPKQADAHTEALAAVRKGGLAEVEKDLDEKYIQGKGKPRTVGYQRIAVVGPDGVSTGETKVVPVTEPPPVAAMDVDAAMKAMALTYRMANGAMAQKAAMKQLVIWGVKNGHTDAGKAVEAQMKKRHPAAWRELSRVPWSNPKPDETGAPAAAPAPAAPAAAAQPDTRSLPRAMADDAKKVAQGIKGAMVPPKPAGVTEEVIAPDDPRHMSQPTSPIHAVPPAAKGEKIGPDRAVAYLLKHKGDRQKAELAAKEDGWEWGG